MNDQIDQLAKLNELKASGALTEEEFADLKKKLLQTEDNPSKVKKKSALSLRSPKTWVIAIAIVIGYQAIKYGVAEADKLPTCQSDQAKNMVVELINKRIRENPLVAMASGGSRAVSIDSAKEIHSDESIRACEGVVKRNNGEGEIGYTIEMGNKEEGEFWVRIYGVDQVRTMFAKAEPPAPPAPVAQQAPTQPTPLAKTPPSDLSEYVDMYPASIFDNQSVQEKFKALLGSEYDHFLGNLSIDTASGLSGIKVVGDYYVGMGCANKHDCDIEEAAFAINKMTNEVFAIYLVEGENIKYAGVESVRDLPPPLIAWYEDRGGQ